MSVASVTPDLVRGVISTKLEDQDIESAISTAIVFYSSKVGIDSRISSPLETEIKRYLAAHFVSIKDPSTRPVKEKIGDASIEYESDSSDLSGGFLSTRWGQTAAALDLTGKLLGGVTVPPRMKTVVTCTS